MKCTLITWTYVAYLTISISSLSGQHINGITSVATPAPYKINPYPRISATNANWICLVPYSFTRTGQTDVWYNNKRQWWGETTLGIVENIKLAKANGFKVCLKPQVYIPGGWTGELSYDTEEKWQSWEDNYTEYIMTFVDIASEYDVEMVCIGTEFKISETEREHYWRSLIESIRCNYSGLVTYSSNWDSFDKVKFWDQLDYVGISSYFPLVDSKTPTSMSLAKAWLPIKKKLRKFYQKTNKQILFTEYGYLSVDGSAGKTWELEKKVHSLPINEEAQLRAFDSLYTQLWAEAFWAGGFIWKWFPNGQGHEGYIPKDYTPQDKLAEKVITFWFGKDINR